LVWIANDSNPVFVEEMKAFAASVGVQLEIRSRVSDEELVDTLNRAALMLYTPHLEPFGLAALEASACGTPVVGIAEAGLRETVINELNGLLTDPEPESIATAIEKLLNDPALAEKYGKQGVDYVNREWTVEGSIDRLEGHLIRTANAAVHTAGTEGIPRPLTIAAAIK
jgi:glycosyltransferase involved in cell wall biosynthesis